MRKSFALLLASGIWLLTSCAARAQFLGYTSQQTVVKTFNIPGDGIVKTPRTIIPVTNFGQAGHGLQVLYSLGVQVCTTRLEASLDNTNWFTLISAPNLNGNNPNHVGYGNGFYPFLRVIVNANDNALCRLTISGGYTGYQFPIPWQATVYNSPNPDPGVAAAALIVPTTTIEYPEPQILVGLSCYNPDPLNTAYLQIMDVWPGPALLGDANILFQVGIGPDETFVQRVPIFSSSALWAGAATNYNGVVAVGTPLVCNFKLNLNGPFGPFLGMPNRL